MFNAAYRNLAPEEFEQRIQTLYKILESCELCPRQCRINRLKGEVGFCKATADVMVSSIGPHFGEEPELVGHHGSGTIFLTHCNLGCFFCQNYDISHLGSGNVMSIDEIVKGMLYLQKRGCHNINFVTPTHYTPQLTKAIQIAAGSGLTVPIVYNCGGYESLEVIRLLEGIVDIYMPDMKYSDSEQAKKYSTAPDYFERCTAALLEMHRQVGVLKTDARGVAERGVLIRHLVMPGDVAGSRRTLEFIAHDLSADSYVNIMFQYRPVYRAEEFPEINRRPRLSEFNAVVDTARELGLHRGFDKEFLLY